MKRIAKLMLVILLISGLSLSVYASTQTKTHIIDNDDAQGYTNNRIGFNTWFQSNTFYYKDARRQICSSDNSFYQYIFPTISSSRPLSVQVRAYLYHPSFTDPVAVYGINSSSSLFIKIAGTINQDLASPGWNVIGTASANISGSLGMGQLGYSTWLVELRPSKNHTGKYCGADAVSVAVTYE